MSDKLCTKSHKRHATLSRVTATYYIRTDNELALAYFWECWVHRETVIS